jgi:hypothetical protein
VVGGSGAGRAKHEWLVKDVLTPVWESGLLAKPWRGTINEFHDALRQHHGFGDFMTQECVLDLMWTNVLCYCPQIEKTVYGWAGPGAYRGLRWLNGDQVRGKGAPKYGRVKAHNMMAQLRLALRDPDVLPRPLAKVLTVHDVEFNLCEFDKYKRALHGVGKPKQKYKPQDQLTLTGL